VVFVSLVVGFALFTHGQLPLQLKLWKIGFSERAAVPSKPFKTYATFYPFYLSEHSHPICRLFHFIGTNIVVLYCVFARPLYILSLMASLGVGFVVNELTRNIETGVVEALVMLAIFVTFNYQLTRTYGIQVLLVGYLFAWIGHFVFEKNRPATFIYPAYSLLSDFRMAFDLYVGNLKFQ